MDDLMGKIQEVLSDEESMKQLSELASSLFSSSEGEGAGEESESVGEEKKENDSGGGMDFDFSKLLMMGQVMNSVSGDKNAELLIALKPLLKEERQAKVDKAVKMLKIFAVFSVLKESGMLNDLF